MNLVTQKAIDTIEKVHGFDDETSIAGEAWKTILVEIERLYELEQRVKIRCQDAVPGWAPELRELLTTD